MIDRLEQFLHIVCSFLFTECLVLLLSDLIKELLSADVLHDQVDILIVIISLKVFHNIRMIEFVKDRYFLYDAIDVLFQFVLIQDFYCNF